MGVGWGVHARVVYERSCDSFVSGQGGRERSGVGGDPGSKSDHGREESSDVRSDLLLKSD